MDNDKEILIGLIKEFVKVGDKIDTDDDNDDNDINDELNALAGKIEEATIPVFGSKVSMDFGTMNAVFYQTEHVINEIINYNKDSAA